MAAYRSIKYENENVIAHLRADTSQMISSNMIKPEQLCKVVEVQKNKKGVVVTEDTRGEQFIIECKGNLMLESKFKEDHPVLAKCSPFVLYYKKINNRPLVMNLVAYGNDARFIRRSCSPTAEVRHVTVENQIRLVVVSITSLAKGSEVTVPFEFPFHEYRHELECACAQDNCIVQKHNLALQSYEQTNGYGRKDEHGLSLIDSSLSNHMDSDSDGDNSNDVKDKRNRKKLSREERKLQAYLRQIEKMEKTEKKRQQSNGSRTGILTQRNFGDDYNCDTPSKPGKGLRKQGISQRHQRKMQSIVRRTHRLPSCSSEPLSPEDNYSSAASTPTTPLVNVVNEEHNEVHTHEENTPEKSFKFPKFKKGSLNDVSSSNGDLTRSNNASPEAVVCTSPSKTSFEARLVDVEMSDSPLLNCNESLSNLEQTINGSTSPARTDPNASPSPCHSTLASPTRSESIDLSYITYRHCSAASPTNISLASYLLSQKERNSSHLPTTLKKRWLLKYFSGERPTVDREMPNGLVSTNSIKQHEIVKTTSQRTFPLPYKRRKLMEYVNSQTVSTAKPADSQTPNDAAAVTVSAVISSVSSVAPNISNSVTSVTTSDVRDSLLLSSSQNCSPVSRNNVEYDEVSSGRSSLSSISSTEDIKSESTFSETRREESQSNVPADSSTGSSAAPVSFNRLSSSSAGQDDGASEENCLTQSDEVMTTVKDAASYIIGSSVDISRHSTVTSGGKKKVSLSEYLNRKRTSSTTVKKKSCPSRSSDVSSRVVDNAVDLPSSSDPVNYRLPSTSPSSNPMVVNDRLPSNSHGGNSMVVNDRLPSTSGGNPVAVNDRLPSTSGGNPVAVNDRLPSTSGGNPVVLNHRLPSSNPVVMNDRLPSTNGSNPVVVNNRLPSTSHGSNPVAVNHRLPSTSGGNPVVINDRLPSTSGGNPVVVNDRLPSTSGGIPVVLNHRLPSSGSNPVVVNDRLSSTSGGNPAVVNHRLASTSGSNPVVVNHRLPSSSGCNPVVVNHRLPSNSGNNPMIVNHRLPSTSGTVVMNYRSSSTSASTFSTTLSSSVTSSTGGAFIEPVSPDDGYSAEDDRPVLHTTRLQDLRITPVVTEAKPSIVVPDSYFNSSLSRPLRVVIEPGSSSDAMDIEEDEAPSSSTILVNTPVVGCTGMSTLTRPYSPLHQMKMNMLGQTSMMNDSLLSPESLRRRPGVVVPSPRIPNHSLPRHQDFNSSSSSTRPASFH